MVRCLFHRERQTEVELERREAKGGDWEAERRKKVERIGTAPGGAEGYGKEGSRRGGGRGDSNLGSVPTPLLAHAAFLLTTPPTS